MRILIIEDEKPAADKLKMLLAKYNSNFEIVEWIDTVKDSVEWLKLHIDDVDLIFMDIRLTDGLSLEIFDQVNVKKPVIFTTAYNEYALDAFKVNSIDYLLKPVMYSDLENSLKKLDNLKEHLSGSKPIPDYSQLLNALNQNQKTYKQRFMVKMGEHINTVQTNDVACLYSEGRIVFLVNNEGRKFIIDYKMEELEEILDPKTFLRTNRSFILNIHEIKDVVMYSKSRYLVKLKQEIDKEIFVSRDKLKAFKDWFEGSL